MLLVGARVIWLTGKLNHYNYSNIRDTCRIFRTLVIKSLVHALHWVEIPRKLVPRDLIMVLAGHVIRQGSSNGDSSNTVDNCKMPI